MIENTSTNVLLIEDNLFDARLVTALIKEAGHDELNLKHVDTLSKGKEQLQSNEYDVILLDLNLPDGEGEEAIMAVKEVASSVPIVIMSGTDDGASSNLALELGVQDYLVKGVGDGHLIARAIYYAIEREKTQQYLRHLAHHDKLTGLANRELFHDRLTRVLARADRGQKMVGLMFLDLDRFKEINDSLGHHAGDELLVMVAKRLQRCIRETDTIARLGGDEFTVIVEGINSPEEAAVVAKKILTVMQTPFTLSGQEVFVTSSIGLTVYPSDADDVEFLLKNADTAMYRAKEQGRNKYQFYSANMNTRARERLRIEGLLHKALEGDEFSLCYQPKVDMNTGEIVGAEALIRWNNDEIGFVSPVDFIPMAEETGLIIPIGEWVIRTTCQQISEWKNKGHTDVRIAVNLSARQFRQGNLAKMIDSILKEYGLTTESLQLEITESLLMSDKDDSKRILEELKAMGFQIYLDDFGTGYSSLSYLKKFPIDALKIDRSFVMDIPDNTDDMAISSAIVAMSHALRLDVVAEGIETMAQYNFLRGLGCEEAQGYLFSKPVPADEFEKLLTDPPDFSETLEYNELVTS